MDFESVNNDLLLLIEIMISATKMLLEVRVHAPRKKIEMIDAI